MNYWGGGDAVVVDDNGLLGTSGFPWFPDITAYLLEGPDDCGSFDPKDMDDDDDDDD